MTTNLEITICRVPTCRAALGQESRDLDYRLCKSCRLCNICGESLTPREIHACIQECEESFDGSLDKLTELIQHPRCSIISKPNADQDPSILVKQSYLDYLNNIRLLWEVETELSPETNEKQAEYQTLKLIHNQPIDSVFLHLSKMQSAVAAISIALAKDRDRIKKVLDTREAKKFKEASRQAATSARPTTRVTDDEIVLAEFMRLNGIKERTVGKALWNKRSKAIQHFTKMGVEDKLAQEMVDKMMVENGSLKEINKHV